MKHTFIGLTLVSSIFFTGCLPQSSDTSNSEESTSDARVGETTLTGEISASGNVAVLTTEDGEAVTIESYAFELLDYVGKKVEVTGEYSGNTLFVDDIVETE